jgi:rod shape-determining protein MreC
VRFVLVLEPTAAQLPARPAPEAAPAAPLRGERQLKSPRRGAAAPASASP